MTTEHGLVAAEPGHADHSPTSRPAKRAGKRSFTTTLSCSSTSSERLLPDNCERILLFRKRESETVTVIGFFSGAVGVVAAPGFVEAADCSEVSSPLLLVLVVVGLGVVVVVVMAEVRASPSAINQPREG